MNYTARLEQLQSQLNAQRARVAPERINDFELGRRIMFLLHQALIPGAVSEEQAALVVALSLAYNPADPAALLRGIRDGELAREAANRTLFEANILDRAHQQPPTILSSPEGKPAPRPTEAELDEMRRKELERSSDRERDRFVSLIFENVVPLQTRTRVRWSQNRPF